MEENGGALAGPEESAEAAHAAAWLVVDAGRNESDPEVTQRLVTLVETVGLDALASLWAQQSARSLPGALWRLYVLREWTRRSPLEASREYAAGMDRAAVSHAVAGAADPPTPQAIQDLTDRILHGVFDGDLGVALERAAALCRVISTGWAASDGDVSAAAQMQTTATDLSACARLWRTHALT